MVTCGLTYLLCSTPNYGHVAPMLAIPAHLVGAGHRVLAPRAMFRSARRCPTGAEHRSLPTSADFDDRVPETFLPDRARHHGLAQARYDIETMFVATIPCGVSRTRSASR